MSGSRGRREASPTVVGLAITSVLLGAVMLLAPGSPLETVRRLAGLGPERQLAARDFEPGTGSFAFLQTQPGSDAPVGYDPCRVIEYAVNTDRAPSDWQELIDTGAARTAAASGLRFEYVGSTDEQPFGPLVAGVRRPVVIGFTDAEGNEELSGDTAGVGGSLAGRAGGRSYYVTGSIALDIDVFDGVSDGVERTHLQAIVDHEFGHLVGLDHVGDPGELMTEVNLGRPSYGPGDLEGLARLGALPCG